MPWTCSGAFSLGLAGMVQGSLVEGVKGVPDVQKVPRWLDRQRLRALVRAVHRNAEGPCPDHSAYPLRLAGVGGLQSKGGCGDDSGEIRKGVGSTG